MKKILFLTLLLLNIFFLSLTTASAAGFKDAFSGSDIDQVASSANYNKTLAEAGPEFYIGLTIKFVFSITGIIMIGLIIYSGITWMTARGNESKVTKAKDTLTELIIGLLFLLGSYALSIFLLKVFTK